MDRRLRRQWWRAPTENLWKKDADAFKAAATTQIVDGVHVAESQTVTVEKAAADWLRSCEDAGLERATLDQYRQHVDLHIKPFLGAMQLSKLGVPPVRQFQDRLR